jgi:hypothetical protein
LPEIELGGYHPNYLMSRSTGTRDGWHPQTAEERDAVIHELRQVLASQQFSSSKRYPALLQYIVENTLAGRSELLKERTLGVEVFDRPPTYDTNADTVVRYTACEVRKRLLLYYSEHGRSSGIRILLPAGSYVPEFFRELSEPDEAGGLAGTAGTFLQDAHPFTEPASETQEQGASAPLTLDGNASSAGLLGAFGMSTASMKAGKKISRPMVWAAAVIVLVAVMGWGWIYQASPPATDLEQFWGPVVREQHSVLICTGSVVFTEDNITGTHIAGKDIDYSFISMQSASAIAQLSGLLQKLGAAMQLRSAGSTPLTELREHSIVLLGGYNNQWTMRLLQSQRFQFTPEPDQAIIDQTQPQMRWSRDSSLPYSNADDYALIARFRDQTTGSWVVVIAGIGRNGTEAAADFTSSPHYMQLLRDRLGKDFSNRNIEAVLKVSVIDGKTGAPSILAVHSR